MTAIVTRVERELAPGRRGVEIVERKGRGHPDSICDALAEHFAVRLTQAYLARCGEVLHFNVDKLLLCAGSTEPRFGGGAIVAPIEIYVGGRATEIDGVPPAELAVAACQEWIRANLPLIDVERGVRILPRIRRGSPDLARLFAAGGARRAKCNDTSIGAGFAPYSDLERVVLAVERALNAAETKARDAFIGSDVKVLGVRRGERIELTIACAFVDRHVLGVDDYLSKKEVVRALAGAAARTETAFDVDIAVNAGDDVRGGRVYLTVTGTSAESGDDGEVGRGNRVSGLITPYRPMTLEAAAGKNPISHVGKLYNIAAAHIADRLARSAEVGDDGAAEVVMVSRIGTPIDEPALVDVATNRAMHESTIGAIVSEELARIDEVRASLLAETLPVF